ncbi:MAG: class I SAM-dependent RNA methyltransferase, partial [Planctomycetes bacterium]|nr:class I SAM-dependent RNA methyltransferase [Planctomycetota bacterium]
MKRAPGLLRSNYCFQHLKSFDEEAYEGIRRDAKSRQAKNKELAHPIIATDIDPNAVRAAQINARTAGVDHLIRFATCDFAQTEIPPAPGILVVNPEYGMRLGEVKELEGTYSRLGDFFKQACTGYTAYVFTGNLDLAKKIGLKASRRMEFWNAKIECRLLKYEMYSGTRRED